MSWRAVKHQHNQPTISVLLAEKHVSQAGLSLEDDLAILAKLSLFLAEGEVKTYRTYKEIPNLDKTFSLNVAELLPVWEL